MSDDLVVVGIGSSAGGLEALQIMLSNLPDIPNCSYIIAQHLSPTHKSMMVELLSRITNLPVIEVKNGMIIKAKSIYMTPENTDINVREGRVYLRNIEQSFGPKPSVNYFFSSLAASFNRRAIGVILSGTGSDGAYGVRAIKAEGGITIAQSPSSAKYDGMPLSAINTGKVDLVVPIEEISQEIQSIVASFGNNIDLHSDERILQEIFKILFEEYGVDFSLYKKSTIIRRIERRMAALKKESLQSYHEILRDEANEVSNLYHDILIGVTSFFRDKESFDILKEHLEVIVAKKEQGEEIRFWSVGCSTGEEAYSIAIILSEILGDKIDKYKIKIFATDIDDESLKIARSGVYAETSLNNVDKNIIQKYFLVQKNQFEVKKSLRELVIFSRHNVVSDSPFLRLDLVTCRNMLIYFSQSLQGKFFPLVHYALNEKGILFLGKSESIGSHLDLFSVVDKNAKIFKVQYTGVKEPPKLFNYSSSYKNYEEPKVKEYKNDEDILQDQIIDALGAVVLDKTVVINSSNDLIYVKGKIPYITHSSGLVSNNIFKLIGDDIGLDLRTAINEANKERKMQLTPFRSVNLFEDVIKYLRIIVVPMKDERNDDWYNILFFQDEEVQNIRGHISSSEDESETIIKLTNELDSTKSHLQNVIEELETSYEEMQSLNEELQSSNEELQSSNEELETTNEELQSTNEELQTAYSELRVLYDDKDKRAKELESLMEKLNFKTEDFRKQKELTEAILDTTPTAVTLVDVNGHLTYVNKFAEELFGVSKKILLNRNFDSKEWKITDYNGRSMNPDTLPFSIIKKTYEPVYNLDHALEINDKKLYISVSGAPLFDVQGVFQGAVFSIEDKTSSRALSDDLTFYKHSLDESVALNKINTYNIMELSLIDTISTFKNELNRIALISHSSKSSTTQALAKMISDKVSSVSKDLDEQVKFYTKRVKYEKTELTSEIEYFCNLFEPVLKQFDIQISKKIDKKIDLSLKAYQLKNIFYNIFEFLISLNAELTSKEKVTVSIINTKTKDIYGVDFIIGNVTYDKAKIDSFCNDFKMFVENKEIEVECSTAGQIKLHLKILGS